MSPSDDDFYKSTLPSQPSPPSSASNITSPSISIATQPINIPTTGKNASSRSHERESGRFGGRPLRSASSFPSSGYTRSESMPIISPPVATAPMPTPPVSPWKRSTSLTRPFRSATVIVDDTPYPDLPSEVRAWSSAHVAEYLAYSLRQYPRAITEDLGRYVRQTACLHGAQFLDLSHEDLERMEINLKWRSMIMKAVGMLRRETLRASRIDSMNWEDGYDPEKDSGQIASPAPSSPTQSDEERSLSHSTSATISSDISHSQENSQPQSHNHNRIASVTTVLPTLDNSDQHSTMENDKLQQRKEQVPIDAQELRRGIVDDISGLLLSWKTEQEAALAKKAQQSNIGGLGFMEGVVIGGLIVAFMMRFAR
ncbi:hypothetical protein FBU30_001249 [Linnemannia zychae]|nr:hypothetical protein FBU30_001249 [Linnemannia zychae]